MAQEEVQNGGAEKVAAVKFTALKPQLMVEAPKAVDAVQFYKSAFGAVEVGHTVHPKRKAEQELPHILSAQLELAGSTILVSDIVENSTPVKTEGGGCVLCLETEDVETAVAKAVSAGGVAESEITEEDGACDGGRVGKVKDPYGYVWLICSPAKKCADV
ncbi:EPIDERMAL PATTERNING FACTOR-like protein 9-like [Hibiscus syriacus]|uniref:EPIDERMAL PATTERNING FACTOR-like protein 9-like n=1 Tax=Hibiscus syriacus TaxID=106335 RepID=A0A6A3A8T2_HIBSY|nr:uncharacterized protein At5g48480-like [Hibiscus syriacus]KAE8699565.1 EPIDERMAL PATTERNING FACTOR-like protein 9-like [Hibiscus syriacus]